MSKDYKNHQIHVERKKKIFLSNYEYETKQEDKKTIQNIMKQKWYSQFLLLKIN